MERKKSVSGLNTALKWRLSSKRSFKEKAFKFGTLPTRLVHSFQLNSNFSSSRRPLLPAIMRGNMIIEAIKIVLKLIIVG